MQKIRIRILPDVKSPQLSPSKSKFGMINELGLTNSSTETKKIENPI